MVELAKDDAGQTLALGNVRKWLMTIGPSFALED